MAGLEVPLGIILIWKGTVASIPAGWKRVTSLDGKFVKGTADATNPDTTGGSDTHTHTSPVHTHTADSHRHYGSLARASAATNGGEGSAPYEGGRDDHYHNFDFTNISSGSLSDAVTYAAGSSLVPYREVIFIEPDTVPAEPASLTISYFSKSSLPTDWNICDGTNSTPDLDAKYLRGAGTGADGGTTGGSATHSHAINHTHSAVDHYHIGGAGGDSDQNSNTRNGPGGGNSLPHHSHSLTLSNVSEAGSAYTGTAGSADSTDLRHTKLIAIQNNVGAASRPQYMIALWLGTLASIPAGWTLCDGNNDTPDMRGYYAKLTSNSTLIGDVSGSNTHTHAASNSHGHSASGSHTHTGSTNYQDGIYVGGGRTDWRLGLGHSHSVGSISSATTSWANTTVQADSSNSEPAYRTVAFIMFTGTLTNDERDAELTGQVQAYETRAAELTGVDPSEQRQSEVTGQDNANSERGAEITGMIEWSKVAKPATPTWTVGEKVAYN